MPRYRITIEYDGRGFVGWQRQDNGLGVQQSIETAITDFCGETPNVFGAGRTDSGVHALGQVAHFDLERNATPDTVRKALNFHLKPVPAVVLSADIATPEFDARFDATERAYRYTIINRASPLTVDRGLAWWIPAPLDVPAMNDAAQALIGHHDFSSFRATGCQATSPVKTLDALEIIREGERIHIAVRARSFLHHQVRNFVGTLSLVGKGKWNRDDVASALAARDRRRGGPTAPAAGLYLVSVAYGKNKD